MDRATPGSERESETPRSSRVKRGLVVEGGGMRCAFAAGALLALHRLGPRDFDVVVGTSAGACCAANFLAGKPEFNRYVLEENLASSRFVRYRNIPLIKRNVMDIDFLVDDCFHTIDELQEKLKDMHTKFLLTVYDAKQGATLFLDAAKENLKEALRATCAIPYFYRSRIYRKGNRIMDGGVTTSIPVQRAIEEGCREIYVVYSRPLGFRKAPGRFAWIHRCAFPRHPHLARHLGLRNRAYNAELEFIENPPPGVELVALRPQQRLCVSRTTRDPYKVRQGIQQGFYDAYEVLSRRSSGSLTS